MNKLLAFSFFLLVASSAIGQVVGTVDKKTKFFRIAPDQKADFTVIGYAFPNITTRKMICFSSNEGVVRANSAPCALGSYFDTDKMRVGDQIFYLGAVGTFAKMNYVAGDGKKTLFYLPKSCFVIK